jgi:hypothetical protein
MKKMFPALAAVAIAISMSAFTIASENSGKKTDLHWFEYNESTGALGTYLGEGDRSAFTSTPCNKTSGVECRRGYADQDLQNPAMPQQGVINVDDNDSDIYRD